MYVVMAVFVSMSFIGCSAVQNAKSIATNMGLSNYKYENVGQGSMRESMINAEMPYIAFGDNKTLVPMEITILSQPYPKKIYEFFKQRCNQKNGQMTVTGFTEKNTLDGVVQAKKTLPYNMGNSDVKEMLNIYKLSHNNKGERIPFQMSLTCNDNQGMLFEALFRGGNDWETYHSSKIAQDYYRFVPIMVTTREPQPDIMYPFDVHKTLDKITSVDDFIDKRVGLFKPYLPKKSSDGIYKLKFKFYTIQGNRDIGGRVGYVNIPEVFGPFYDFYYLAQKGNNDAKMYTPYGDMLNMFKSYLWVKGGYLNHDEDYDGYYGVSGTSNFDVTMRFNAGYQKDNNINYDLVTMKKGFDNYRIARQKIKPVCPESNAGLKSFQKYECESKEKSENENKTFEVEGYVENSGKTTSNTTNLNREIAKKAAENGYVEKINGNLLYQGIKTGEKGGCDTVGIIKKDGDDVRSKRNFKVCRNKVTEIESTTTEQVSASLRLLLPRVIKNCNLHGKASLSKGAYTVKCKQPNLNKGLFEIFYLRENLLIGYETINIEQQG